jgi:uracil-DNA glycosylase
LRPEELILANDLDNKPNFHKSLPQLREEWSECERCDLGVQRIVKGGAFVFGEGQPRGIMFIGEGPGKTEEATGRPFTGKSGQLLRAAIQKLGLERVYISNVVACRSCGQTYDGEGNPRFRKDRKTGILIPDIQDRPPFPTQMQACLPRLYEEIYLVDPVLIVALGAEAAKILSRQAVSIVSSNGALMTISIPGAGSHPVVTDKKKEWAHKIKKQWVAPVAQNTVQYLMIPVVHPAYVLRRQSDQRLENPTQKFADGLKRAAAIYDHYILTTYGEHPQVRELSEDDVAQACEEGEENG